MRMFWFAALVGLMLAGTAAAAELPDQVTPWRTAHEPQIVNLLAELTAVPSVAANPAGLDAMAKRLETELSARGFAARQITVPGAPPVVYAERRSPGATRTVVFYAHYDGQPVDPSEWKSDPFTPVMRTGTGQDAAVVDWRAGSPPYDPEWRLFGRAASDDKSSITAFLAAWDALTAIGRAPSVNIKVFWEGEEERNSPHLAAVLDQWRSLLAADLWLIGDAPLHQSRTRTLYFGARGSIDVEATVYGPLRPLHSGHYGNWSPNPAAMAAQLIVDLRDPQGRVRIPGFYAAVRPLTPGEKRAIASLPPVELNLRRELGLAAAESDEGLTLSTMRPALNIDGLRAGGSGRAIPSQAVVSIDFRLVPDQSPGEVRQQLEARLKALGWTVVHSDPDLALRGANAKLIKLAWSEGYPGLRSEMDSPAAKAVLAAAGRPEGLAVLPMMGGSVPIYLFREQFKVPVIGLPIANHDNNQHAANENARLANLWDGIELYAEMMSKLDW